MIDDKPAKRKQKIAPIQEKPNYEKFGEMEFALQNYFYSEVHAQTIMSEFEIFYLQAIVFFILIVLFHHFISTSFSSQNNHLILRTLITPVSIF